MRQIILDTETTGLEVEQGHRIIEIGALEMVDRKLTGRNFHSYVNPERESEEGALEVHGITAEFLEDKPPFPDIAEDLLSFIGDGELVIHNAPFDLGFLDYELGLMDHPDGPLSGKVKVLDTLELARDLHPGQRNNLDALCKRYEVDNSSRTLHGALLDAEILADVYLAMTGGQTDLGLSLERDTRYDDEHQGFSTGERPPLRVLRASESELAAHRERLRAIEEQSDSGECLWLVQEESARESP
ncbi:MAG: DNA polymerase III subunit epsilon [Xanthomonadales bacterium]|nr:DNA polymerase III subunit epsilon [Xanthomonadales bacterium]NIX13868.1 DNA polymerase III subunit epsilon [Xanthomonadales bacterium]